MKEIDTEALINKAVEWFKDAECILLGGSLLNIIYADFNSRQYLL